VDKPWAWSLRTKRRKNVHINSCPETFNLWVIAERIRHRHQQQFSIGVEAGIVGGCLAGPYVLPHRLTGNHYQEFLSCDLPNLLEYVPLAVRARMWCMHDGAPAHFRRAVRDVLSNTYHVLCPCVCESPPITFECQNRSLWKLVNIAWDLSPSQQRTL
jgi:hypothetical protein